MITNQSISLDTRCQECFRRSFNRIRNRFSQQIGSDTELSVFFETLIMNSFQMSGPEIQRELQMKLVEMTGITDPYREEKNLSNQLALELYKDWRPRVLASDDPFLLALRLSIAGNIMDYGAFQQFDLHQTIDQVVCTNFYIDHSSMLRERIRNARSILFLGDNAGEIVFDKLLIEVIMHPNVHYAVKGGPALNDVTLDDALEVGMDSVADVITNGYNASSTLLDKSSDSFRNLYHSADIIVSKGQGNFEGLLNHRDPRLFFLMMVKCDLIAEKTGAPKGSYIVLNYGKN